MGKRENLINAQDVTVERYRDHLKKDLGERDFMC